MSMTEFVEEAFVNEFGQKIEPGEEVLYAGTSMKSTHIGRATFKGVRYANVTRHKYETDENGRYIQEDFTDSWGRTYKRNKHTVETSREVIAVVVRANRGKKYVWTTDIDGKQKYVKSDVDVFGTSTLPLKRVYKFNTSLSEMAGKRF
jgi:hypothetical protein